MVSLHRHQLARLNASGWASVSSQVQTDEHRRCVQLWADRGLPLVITRQSCDAHSRVLSLGMVTPARWGRQRLLFKVAPDEVCWFDEFPESAQLTTRLPPDIRVAWESLSACLREVGSTVRVFGSHGWQFLTGLRYAHAHSDIDLWMSVADEVHADAVVKVLLEHSDDRLPKIDGELCFPRGRAVAWREWSAWRAGATRQILVKHLRQIELRSSWADDPARAAA